MSRLRVGIIGAGSWSAAVHLPELRRHDVDVAIVSSREQTTAERIGALFDVPRTTTRWEDVPDADLDAIIVSSPPSAHREQVVAALRSGAHVLSEKPMSVAPKDATAMLRTSEETGRGLLVGFGWPFSALFTRAKAVIDSGAIGAIEHVEMRLHANIRELLTGTAELEWQRKGVTSEPSTYRDPANAGGGAITTTLSHALGMLSWLTGDAIARVAATASPSGNPIDLHGAIAGSLTGGASVSLSYASTSSSSPGVGWQVALSGSAGELLIDFAEGTLRLQGAKSETIRLTTEQAANRPGAPTSALLDLARTGVVPAACSGRLGALTVYTTDAIATSFRTGQVISVDRRRLPAHGW